MGKARKVILGVLILSLVFPLAGRAEELLLTLEEALNLALRDNREVLLKAEEVKKAKAKISEAQADLFPSLDLTGTYAYTRGLYANNLGSFSGQATLKQYLYKGGETTNTIAQNKYKEEVSRALLDKTKIETVLNVAKAYYAILLSSELVVLNRAIADNTKEHLDFLKARYQNGQAPESDILKIQEALSNVEQVYQASLNQLQAALALLNNLLALESGVQIRPDGELNCTPKEAAYEEAFLKAMEKRPEIKQYAAQGNADQKAIEIAKADNRPDIYASWDYYSRSHTSLTFTPIKAWQDYNIIGITVSWPIFDGWATKLKLEQAIIDLKTTKLNQEKIIADIALELKNAYFDLKSAMEKIKYSEAQLALYADTVSVMQKKYQSGMASLLDLKDTLLSFAVSQFNKKQAVYDYLVAKTRFEKASGGR